MLFWTGKTRRRALLAMAMLAASAGAGMLLAATEQAAANGDVIHISSTKNTSIRIAKGKPRTIKTNVPFYEIVIGDPEVANVNPLTDDSFYVLGNNLGTTGIALFDENKQLVGTVDIEVTLDTDRLASTIRNSVPGGEDIRVSSANGRVVLSGSANDQVAADKASKIASNFSGEEEVINSVNISSSQQVQLNVRFVEINRQVGQELGTKIAATYLGHDGGISFNSEPSASSGASAGDIVGRLLTNGWTIDVAIKALEDRGVARRLAEPNLIARSGQKASFLAGGEVPIPVSGDEGEITVDYKKFGVGLEFTPTVLADGLISLEIAPEVSSVDRSANVDIGNGITVPSFVVRRAQTSIDLKNGQSFMMAGLLQTENNMINQSIPGLGKLPVLGPLFSSKSYQRRETDLVIIVTPYLVKPIDPSKKPGVPTDATLPASPVEYFLGNKEEIKVSDAGVPLTKPGAIAAQVGSGHILDLPED
jgi:pilus assembly protein CpaC